MRIIQIVIIIFLIFLMQKPAEASSPFILNQKLGRGINLGNALEAPREGEWGVVLKEEYFQLIAAKGFNSIRIPIRWSTHATTRKPYTIDEKFFNRVDWVIENAQKYGLYAIINFHHYEELYVNPKKERERFLAMWEQVANHYKDYSENLVFEILNEPHNNLTPEYWNSLLSEALTIIRGGNPQRIVMIGTAEWGGTGALSKLQLPDDDHLILTIHFYNPFQFTHQGADWSGEQARHWLGTTWKGNYYEKKAIIKELEPVFQYSQEKKIPVNIGEFGAFNKADMESRALWTTFCARLFESYGFSWHYWEFCSGFGIYNPKNGRFYDELVKALVTDDTTILKLGDPAEETGAELLNNGSFSAADTNWLFGVWQAPAQAIGKVIHDEFVVDVKKEGTESWQIQLIQDGLALEEESTYILSFDARAAHQRNLTATIDGGSQMDYFPFGNANIELTTEMNNYFLLVNMKKSIKAGRVVFSFAGDTGLVYIDNISLKKLLH